MPEPLEGRLLAVLIGSILGDGHISRANKKAATFCEDHAIGQESYLRWKMGIWGDRVRERAMGKNGDLPIRILSDSLLFVQRIFYLGGKCFMLER